MSQYVLIELELPKDWVTFRIPAALHRRLQELLDRQDQTGKLSAKERQEAMALTNLADMFLDARAGPTGSQETQVR